MKGEKKVVEIEFERLEKIVELLSKAYVELDEIKKLLLEIGQEIR